MNSSSLSEEEWGMCVCAYVCVCVRACICVCVHAYVSVCVHACACMHMCVHVYLRACVCVQEERVTVTEVAIIQLCVAGVQWQQCRALHQSWSSCPHHHRISCKRFVFSLKCVCVCNDLSMKGVCVCVCVCNNLPMKTVRVCVVCQWKMCACTIICQWKVCGCVQWFVNERCVCMRNNLSVKDICVCGCVCAMIC